MYTSFFFSNSLRISISPLFETMSTSLQLHEFFRHTPDPHSSGTVNWFYPWIFFLPRCKHVHVGQYFFFWVGVQRFYQYIHLERTSSEIFWCNICKYTLRVVCGLIDVTSYFFNKKKILILSSVHLVSPANSKHQWTELIHTTMYYSLVYKLNSTVRLIF